MSPPLWFVSMFLSNLYFLSLAVCTIVSLSVDCFVCTYFYGVSLTLLQVLHSLCYSACLHCLSFGACSLVVDLIFCSALLLVFHCESLCAFLQACDAFLCRFYDKGLCDCSSVVSFCFYGYCCLSYCCVVLVGYGVVCSVFQCLSVCFYNNFLGQGFSCIGLGYNSCYVCCFYFSCFDLEASFCNTIILAVFCSIDSNLSCSYCSIVFVNNIILCFRNRFTVCISYSYCRFQSFSGISLLFNGYCCFCQ